MPTVVKSSAEYSDLGDLSTYTVSTAAMPADVVDSNGSVPTIGVTLVDGKDTEYLIGEDFSLATPSLGQYDGDIVNVSMSKGTNRYSIDVHNIMSRLNTEHRLYPLADYNGIESVWLPLFTLEYWTQQCGIFYSKVPGAPLFYQSQYGHFGAWARDITRPLKTDLAAVSEQFQAAVIDGRLMNNIPRNSIATLTFPTKKGLTDMGTSLPVLIPGDTGFMVFGLLQTLTGTSRRGHTTWRMVDANGVKRHIRVTGDVDAGFTLYTSENGTTYTSRGNIPAPAGGTYTIYVGVSQIGVNTSFDFYVYNSDNSLRGSLNSTILTGIRGSLSLTQVLYVGDDVGSGAKMHLSDVFISLMDSVPVGTLAPQKSITTGVKTSAHMVGFSGNVWEHMKQYCAIYHIDVNYRNGKLTFEPRQTDIKVGASLSSLGTTIQNRETARNIEVVNQQHTATGSTPKTLWSADTVYQVAVGEVQEFTVQTKHSIMSVSQPVCVSGINPFPYTSGSGQYVVTGSDGYIVSPSFWTDQGGSITCDITENEGEIKVRIKAPDFDSPRAPYRISEGDAGRPALHITGQGVKSDPKTMKIPTGNSKAAKDVGTTIDCPFVGNPKVVYDVACRASKAFASAEISTTFAEPIGYDEDSALGDIPAGQLFKQDGNIYRVTGVDQTSSMVSGNAVQHNTIYQINRSFGTGNTVDQRNAYYDGKPISKINLKPVRNIASV